MVFDPKHLIQYLWITAGIVWLIGAFAVKQTSRRQSPGSRLVQLALGAVAFMIGFSSRFQFESITRPFLPDSPIVDYSGLMLTVAGIGFGIWARFSLGENWSGTVTVKEHHSLVMEGPYAIVRHPIYTGLLLALTGTVIAYREIRGLVALGLVLVMLLLKIRIEERFMREQFGAEYSQYCRRVKALVPFVY